MDIIAEKIPDEDQTPDAPEQPPLTREVTTPQADLETPPEPPAPVLLPAPTLVGGARFGRGERRLAVARMSSMTSRKLPPPNFGEALASALLRLRLRTARRDESSLDEAPLLGRLLSGAGAGLSRSPAPRKRSATTQTAQAALRRGSCCTLCLRCAVG